ncbi:M16 family metallopeptidase [Azotobacter chroococcum]|uniref:Zinc protease n=1 Tax=Azotobacter chroococcum TaxID=353 RepID=A0A4R1PPH2_9GAMM|nr:pitrilysin family protein [Azotobacter chroococcum]TBV99792.1 insulinase family protein [Azotobacter chroococcum]TCL31516.1 zinc protease [Azotobacter chroococcum]
MTDERTRLSYGLIGLILLLLLGLLAWLANLPPRPSAPAGEAPTGPARLESLANLNGEPPVHRALNIQDWRTAEGARVLFVEARQLPMFDLRLTFAAGSSQDGDTPGLALLTNAMLNEGVPGKDATAIAEGFEGLGAQFGNGAYRDMAVASLRSLSDPAKREPALALFREVLGRPDFPADALARIKNQMLAGFEMRKQSPGKLASLALNRQLFGSHPYAHPSDGDTESIAPIGREQLQAFHARAYSAANAVIALVGDLSRSEAEAMAAAISAALPAGPALAKPAAPAPPKPGLQHIEYPSQQTHLMLAQLGIARDDPDYAALFLGNQILGGGGFGARLMEEVREKRGLTYGIYSGFTPMQVRGPFMINLQTRADYSQGTLELVQQLVRAFIAEGPTAKELKDAKRELIGSFPLSTASNADIVGQLGAIGFYNLPLNHLEVFLQQVQALTVEQVKTAMARHIDPDGFVVVSAGPTVEQKPLPPPTAPAERPAVTPEH